MASKRSRTAKELMVTASIACMVTVAVFGASRLGYLQDVELGAYDQLTRWLAPEPSPSKVALIWIREDEIARYGHPISDELLAETTTRLLALGPRVIGIDLYRDRAIPPGSERLASVLIENPNIFIVEKLADAVSPRVPAPTFMPASRVGFSDMPVDTDGVVRRTFVMMWDRDDSPHLAFSLVLALGYLNDDQITLTADPTNPAHVMLGPTAIPALDAHFGGYVDVDAGGYQTMFDQARAREQIPSYSLSALLDGDIAQDALADKVVVIATKSPSVKDSFQTATGRSVFGGELHARATAEVIRLASGESRPISALDDRSELAWWIAWCVLGAVIGRFARNAIVVGAMTLGAFVALTAFGLASLEFGVWIPAATPAIAFIGAFGLSVGHRTRQEHVEREQMMQLFGSFVSKRIVSEIWNERDAFMDGARPRPERAAITTMQTDLSGYTNAAASLEPVQVMEWIGRYMETMAELVESHGGVVNDFTGDGLMANFGVPVPRSAAEHIESDARNAVRCAQAMDEALDRLNEEWRAAGLPTARMRIGICSGPAVIGAYGSRDRLKYTSVGTTINTAARLESYDKQSFYDERGGNRILVSRSTIELLDDAFRARSLGVIELKGLSEPTEIFRIVKHTGLEENEEEHLLDTADRAFVVDVGTGEEAGADRTGEEDRGGDNGREAGAQA